MKKVRRYDLDPVLVGEQVRKKIQEYEDLRVRLLKNEQERQKRGRPPYANQMIDEWIAKERTHYATVRVLHVPRGYLLVYGEQLDTAAAEGTGPFKTLEEAKRWFLNGGR